MASEPAGPADWEPIFDSLDDSGTRPDEGGDEKAGKAELAGGQPGASASASAAAELQPEGDGEGAPRGAAPGGAEAKDAGGEERNNGKEDEEGEEDEDGDEELEEEEDEEEGGVTLTEGRASEKRGREDSEDGGKSGDDRGKTRRAEGGASGSPTKGFALAGPKDAKKENQRAPFTARLAVVMHNLKGEGQGSNLDLEVVGENDKKRRVERNQREQRRSLRISRKIEELHEILTANGRSVKANKSAILSDAFHFIQHLQNQLLKQEYERSQFVRMLSANGGVMATAQDQAAVPLGSMMFGMPGAAGQAAQQAPMLNIKKVADMMNEMSAEDSRGGGIDYEMFFRECNVPCAIAGMDGRILQMNRSFQQTCVPAGGASAPKDMTIFNFVDQGRLPEMFSLIGMALRSTNGKLLYFEMPVAFQGVLSRDMVMVVSLVRDALWRARFFCVSLVDRKLTKETTMQDADKSGDGMLHYPQDARSTVKVKAGLQSTKKAFAMADVSKAMDVISKSAGAAGAAEPPTQPPQALQFLQPSHGAAARGPADAAAPPEALAGGGAQAKGDQEPWRAGAEGPAAWGAAEESLGAPSPAPKGGTRAGAGAQQGAARRGGAEAAAQQTARRGAADGKQDGLPEQRGAAAAGAARA